MRKSFGDGLILINCACLAWIWWPKYSHFRVLSNSQPHWWACHPAGCLPFPFIAQQIEMTFAIFGQLTLEEMNHTLLVWWWLLPVMHPVQVRSLHPLNYPCNLTGFYEVPCRNPSSLAQIQNSSECLVLPMLDQIQMHTCRKREILHTQSPLSKHTAVEILFMIYCIARKSRISL